jgi:transcriptional regulator of arginine metabolism
MSDAQQRRETIARLLRARRIGTQEELLSALLDAGQKATQATLSRDLARLRARRVLSSAGGSFYEVPGEQDSLSALRELVTSVGANASMVVIRTRPGSANAVARAIDVEEIPEILGTIAGDDTIFVAPSGELRPKRLASRLAALLRAPESTESQGAR